MTDHTSRAAPPGREAGEDSGVAERARETAEVAQQKMGEGAQQARGRLRDEVDRRSTQAGEQTGATAEALRAASQRLREEGQDQPAQAAERAAHQLDRAARWLRESDGDGILRDVEQFGRRRPMVFALGGAALGFAAARFLKASSAERYRSGTGDSHGSPALPARTTGSAPPSTPPVTPGYGSAPPPVTEPPAVATDPPAVPVERPPVG